MRDYTLKSIKKNINVGYILERHRYHSFLIVACKCSKKCHHSLRLNKDKTHAIDNNKYDDNDIYYLVYYLRHAADRNHNRDMQISIR